VDASGLFGYTDQMLETEDIGSSVEECLGELRNRSNALFILATSKARSPLNLENELGTIREPLIQLQGVRDRHPAEVMVVIHQCAVEVGETYETVMDVSDLVDACNRPEVINLALEIRTLLQPANVNVAHAR
jgi:hypothetical protein